MLVSSYSWNIQPAMDKEAWRNIAYLTQISRYASYYSDPLQQERREIT